MPWNIKTKSHDKWKRICIDYSMVPRTSCFLGDHISTSRPHKYLHAFDLALLTYTLWYTYGIKYTLLAHKYIDICHIPNKQTSSDTVPFFMVCVTNINYCHLLVQNVVPLILNKCATIWFRPACIQGNFGPRRRPTCAFWLWYCSLSYHCQKKNGQNMYLFIGAVPFQKG